MKAEKTRELIEKLIFPKKLSGFEVGTYKDIDDELNEIERLSELGLCFEVLSKLLYKYGKLNND